MSEREVHEDETSTTQVNLARQIFQRLQALQRLGVDRIPYPAPAILEMTHSAEVSARLPAELPPPPVTVITQERTPLRPPILRQPEPTAAIRVADQKPPAKPSPPPLPAAPLPALFGDAGFDTPPVPAEERPGLLLEIAKQVSNCPKCPILAATRTKTVFGDGTPTPRLMFIGEAPGADEDRQGIPFIGRAGQLLTDMITKGMGIRREDVYIANILKCRPPGNRDPQPDECANCLPYLERQLEIIRPEFLCLLGRVAAQNLLQTTIPMGKLRGRWHSVRGIKALVTYHPSYLLRNPPAKKDAWEDLQIIMNAMGLSVPTRKKE